MMKKWYLRVSTLAMTGLIVCFTAACTAGKAPESSPASQAGNSISQPEESNSSAVSQAAPTTDGKMNSINDFVNTTEFQDQIEDLKETLRDQGLDMEITAEGNKLIYTYRYLVEVDTETVKETLETGLDAQEGTFKAIAQSIATAVNVESPVIVVRYLDQEGNLICEREFAA